MTRNASLPTLFGRFSIISGEHQRLSTTLRQLAEMCLALDAGSQQLGADSDPRRLLAALQLNLERHFATEEADDYFGAVARERPSLLPSIANLRAEHTAMLETTAELGAISADEHRWAELCAPTLRLLERLRAHEQAESLLLQDFFEPAED